MDFSGDELALIVEGKVKKFENGHKSRNELLRELIEFAAENLPDGEVIITDGKLQSQGRASFGRANEGREGTAIFLPEQVED